MEFAAAALTTISSAMAPAAGVAAVADPLAVAGAAGGGGMFSSLLSASSAGSILSGAATIGSVLSTQRAGDEAQWAYEQKALDAGVNVKAEEVAGQQRKNSLRAALITQLGQRDVQTAASGVDLSFGSPVTARELDIADSERALSIDQSTTDARVARLRQQADTFRILGSQARSGALAKAAGIGLTGAAALLRRG